MTPKLKSNLASLAAGGILLACAATFAAQDDSKDLACNGITDLALATFKARTAGMTEAQALNRLRERGIYSGAQVWAVKAAYRAPATTPEFVLRGSVFGECTKRDDVGTV